MRVAFLIAVVALLPDLNPAAPQASEEEAIKAVVHAQVKAFYDRNFDAWQALWIHDANVSRSIVQNGAYISQTGWDTISAQLSKEMKAEPTPVAAERTLDKFIVRRDGNLAWVFWDQQSTFKDPNSKSATREYRVLLKDRGQWKIASQITLVSSSFEGPDAVENSINSAGYALLEAGKPQDALEVLKVNVRLSPQSWNAYDSLGEAYAAAGQKDLAIQNYEKSLELNPKNESGRAALAKLRQH
jgi:tetratricopeptide (TPR) repeat protein